ncbi:putative receptor-like protein kinase [Sesbania bispinosa]|nr:putative receptor-like protein kinase [Sesbania bispinosa]
MVAKASSSNNNNPGTSGTTPNLTMELQYYSHIRKFTFHELKLATKNFKAGNFLGEGGFGTDTKAGSLRTVAPHQDLEWGFQLQSRSSI